MIVSVFGGSKTHHTHGDYVLPLSFQNGLPYLVIWLEILTSDADWDLNVAYQDSLFTAIAAGETHDPKRSSRYLILAWFKMRLIPFCISTGIEPLQAITIIPLIVTTFLKPLSPLLNASSQLPLSLLTQDGLQETSLTPIRHHFPLRIYTAVMNLLLQIPSMLMSLKSTIDPCLASSSTILWPIPVIYMACRQKLIAWVMMVNI